MNYFFKQAVCTTNSRFLVVLRALRSSGGPPATASIDATQASRLSYGLRLRRVVLTVKGLFRPAMHDPARDRRSRGEECLAGGDVQRPQVCAAEGDVGDDVFEDRQSAQ